MANIRFKLDGLKQTLAAVDRVIDARSPKGIRKNFRTIARYALGEVKMKTPGKGKLRAAWVLRYNDKIGGQGYKFTAEITNRKVGKNVYYVSAYDGKRRLKRKADDSPQKWEEVIYMLDVGTRAHTIKPRRYRALIFNVKNAFAKLDDSGFLRDSRSGRFAKETNTVFAKGVKHPGTKAYRMITDTEAKLNKLMDTAADNVGENIITTWTAGGTSTKGPRLRGIIPRATV